MYAVVQTGGKQYRVSEGEQVAVERLGDVGASVSLRPVLIVDGERVVASSADLDGATVEATIVDDNRGPKITGFTYKNKTRQRRRWGHRQARSVIQIDRISEG